MLKDLQNIKKNKYIDQGGTDAKQSSKDDKMNVSYDDEEGLIGMMQQRQAQSTIQPAKQRSSFQLYHDT